MEAQRARVLVIDDDQRLGTLVGRMLAREHEVTVLTTARAALDRIAAGEHFDVMLCDLMMPALTGEDFVERVTSIAPELVDRVIITTGGAFTPAAEAFLRRTSIRQLAKPFGLAELRGVVEEVLRGRGLR